VVAISRSHARTAPEIPVAAVIHHGIDLTVYEPGPGRGNYLLFIGRMSPEKGVHHAARVAAAAGVPLLLVAKMRDRSERDYFEREVRPLLCADVRMIGELTLRRRIELLRNARALLNPIDWDEPFGLVMVEALACGTPVLAFARGAATEIVDHARTGFLCAHEDDMLAAVARVAELDRGACREAAERRFSLLRMARDYEDVYARLGRPSSHLGWPEDHGPDVGTGAWTRADTAPVVGAAP
jgi:glycosyltransferase involved in cell wall biosynthesis